MAYIFYNPNPIYIRTTDCVVRACSIATGSSWDDAYEEIAYLGQIMGRMPDLAVVWGAYLRLRGFNRAIIPDRCPDCYTVREFAYDHPEGTYVLAIDGSAGHVVCVIDGDWIDIFDSGDEIPTFYYYRR